MKKEELNLDRLVEVLGDYKVEGAERVFKCPYCTDTHRDNMKFNVEKKIITCFADSSHSRRFLREMYFKNWNNYKSKKNFTRHIQVKDNKITEPRKIIQLDAARKDLFRKRNYISNQELLRNSEYLQFLLTKRRITKETVQNCKIGLNVKKNRFEFPIFEFNPINSAQTVISFEFRPLDLSKNGLYREKNTPTGLAQINSYVENTRYLIVIGGFIDGYSLFQWLKEHNKEQYFQIITSTNGENTTLKHLKEYPNIEDVLKQYEKTYIFLDNDTTGIREALKIKEEFQNVEIIKFQCSCKDFNEHYTKGCTQTIKEFKEV